MCFWNIFYSNSICFTITLNVFVTSLVLSSFPADTILIPSLSALSVIAVKGSTKYLNVVVPEPYPNPKWPWNILLVSSLQLQSPIELQLDGNASFPIIAILLYLVFDKGRTSFSFFNNTLLWPAASRLIFFVSSVIVSWSTFISGYF